MPARVPKLCFHKGVGQFYVRVDGRQVYLGTDALAAEAERVRLLTAAAAGLPAAPSPDDTTVNQLLVAYLTHCEGYYRKPDGTPTTEVRATKHAMRPVQRVLGSRRTADVTPRDLEDLQRRMADGSWKAERDGPPRGGGPEGWNRRVINQHTGRVKRCFRWGCKEGLVPVAVWQRLDTVGGVRRGQTKARDGGGVRPAPPASVEAVSTRAASPHVRAMVRVQLLTGMRPGEVCSLRPCDLDTTGRALGAALGVAVELAGCWAYLPPEHKTAHHGHLKVVPVGPQAQAVLAPFLEGCRPDRPLFSARASSPRRGNALDHYTAALYNKAISRACRRLGVEHFHAHQLRHSAATFLVAAYGWEICRIILGHRSLDVTRIYATDSLGKAFAAMRESG